MLNENKLKEYPKLVSNEWIRFAEDAVVDFRLDHINKDKHVAIFTRDGIKYQTELCDDPTECAKEVIKFIEEN